MALTDLQQHYLASGADPAFTPGTPEFTARIGREGGAGTVGGTLAGSPDLAQARTRAGELGQQAVKYAGTGYTLPDELRQALLKKFDFNKDLIEAQSRAQAEYFAAPAEARAEYIKPIGAEDYISPVDVESLVAQRRAQAYAPYASLTGILGERKGTLEDIVGTAGRAWTGRAATAGGLAEVMQQQYQNLLNEYQVGVQQDQFKRKLDFSQQAQKLDEAFRRYELEQEQERWKTQWPFEQAVLERQAKAPYYKGTEAPTTPTFGTTGITEPMPTAPPAEYGSTDTSQLQGQNYTDALDYWFPQ